MFTRGRLFRRVVLTSIIHHLIKCNLFSP